LFVVCEHVLIIVLMKEILTAMEALVPPTFS